MCSRMHIGIKERNLISILEHLKIVVKLVNMGFIAPKVIPKKTIDKRR